MNILRKVRNKVEMSFYLHIFTESFSMLILGKLSALIAFFTVFVQVCK